MHFDVDPVCKSIVNCAFVHSNEHFSDRQILHQTHLAGLFDTDIFVESSFSITGQYPLTGAVIKTFTKDNMENENFLVYSLPLPNFQASQAITLELQKRDFLSLLTLKNFLFSLPLLSLLIFNLIILLLPPLQRNIFFYLNIAAMVVIVGVYFYSVMKFLIRFLKHSLEQTPEEIMVKHSPLPKALTPLSHQSVSTAVLYEGNLYLKQDLNEKTFLDQVRAVMDQLLSPQFRASLV